MTFTLNLDKHNFTPNEQVSGSVEWKTDVAPEEIRVVLAWQTDGRGTQDSKSESIHTIENSHTQGRESFNLSLPASPYSFSGTLIHLQWFVEARSKKGKLVSRVPIDVGPDAEKVSI